MSTFASAQLDSSDDEADTDFIPTAPKSAPNGKGSSSKRKASSHHSLNLKIVRSSKLAKRRIPKGSDDQAGDDAEGPDESSAESSSDSEDEEADGDELDEEREAKRRRLQEEEEGRKKRAREAFASFANPSPESSVKETGESSTDTGAGAGVKGLVEVQRPRQFAGETIYETVRLPADHPDAIAYFSSPHTPSTPSGTRGTADVPKGADTAAVNSPAMPAAQGARPAPEHTALPDSAVARPDSTTAAPTAPTSTTTAPIASSSNSIPPKRPPPKRKPRQSLEAMSAALDKGKKMTTLEKSQMDWQSHLSSTTGLSDELASNRKAGGYLEKRDFLERVEDRRTGAYDQIKKGRR